MNALGPMFPIKKKKHQQHLRWNNDVELWHSFSHSLLKPIRWNISPRGAFKTQRPHTEAIGCHNILLWPTLGKVKFKCPQVVLLAGTWNFYQPIDLDPALNMPSTDQLSGLFPSYRRKILLNPSPNVSRCLFFQICGWHPRCFHFLFTFSVFFLFQLLTTLRPLWPFNLAWSWSKRGPAPVSLAYLTEPVAACMLTLSSFLGFARTSLCRSAEVSASMRAVFERDKGGGTVVEALQNDSHLTHFAVTWVWRQWVSVWMCCMTLRFKLKHYKDAKKSLAWPIRGAEVQRHVWRERITLS